MLFVISPSTSLCLLLVWSSHLLYFGTHYLDLILLAIWLIYSQLLSYEVFNYLSDLMLNAMLFTLALVFCKSLWSFSILEDGSPLQLRH
jgi:hypothetical protein